MNKRLCSRSQLEIREVCKALRKEVLEVLPELEKYLVPDCKAKLYCTEEKCCGLAPRKDEIISLINKNK